MYEAYYGFKEKPFSMLPDPGFLFLSKKHQAALTLLEYGLLNHVGFCVISGEPGAGKTTILRAILEHIGDDVTIGLITNTHQTFGGLLDWILSVFDLHKPDLTQVEMHQVFMDFLIDEYANNRTVLLIVDEAQNMNADSLEELRMLSNVNTEKDQLLQVVLAGQPALKDMLRRPELMQFAQRIAVDYHLDPLSLEETCGYIQHRLEKAGAIKDVFSPIACQRIYEYSGGTPRLINLLCETVLVYGFADQKQLIDADMVDEMVQERMKDSVVPIASRDKDSRDDPEVIKKLEANFPHIGRVRPDEKDKEEDIKEELVQVSGQGTTETSGSEDAKKNLTRASQDVTDKVSVSATESQSGQKQARVKRGSGKKAPEMTPSSGPRFKQEKNAKPEVRKTSADIGDKAPIKDSASKKTATKITGQKIPPAIEKPEDSTRKRLVIYGAFATVVGFVLIMLAVILDNDIEDQSVSSKDESSIQQHISEQQETKRLIEERLKADRLEKQQAETERLAAEQQVEAEQQAEQLAEEQLAEEQRVKEEAARQEAAKVEALRKEQAKKEKLLREEQQRIARDKKAAIEKQKAREEKYEAERERRKAERLEQERLLKEQEEARRLQQEWLEEERKALEKKQ